MGLIQQLALTPSKSTGGLVRQIDGSPPLGAAGGPYIKGQAVGESRDLRRVLALPMRVPPTEEQLKRLSSEFKAQLGTGATTCVCVTKFKRRCCSELLPIQAWALGESREIGGLVGPIGVGHGKTLLDLLVSMVVPGCKTALLLLPPNLRKQLLDVDWHFYGQHWKLPNLAGGRWLVPGRPTLHVVAFSELSGASATDLLQRLRPDVIIVDEAHNIRNRTAARTKRFLRYFAECPVRLFAWSGTFTSKSIKDYAHISNLALRDGSPTPLHWPTVEEWAGHLDPSTFRSPPGRLTQFGADVTAGYRRRLLGTPGVVSSGDSDACQASLIISERVFSTPAAIQKHIESVEATWQRPDGEEFVDAMSVGRCLRELSCGFFYRWRWPRKESVEVIERWLAARKDWHKELREKLKLNRPHLDSPLLCAKAAIRWFSGYVHIYRDAEGNALSREQIPPKTKDGPMPAWASQCWQEWEQVRNTAKPESEAVWLDESFAHDCLAWLAEAPGLLWYEFDGLARKLLQLAKGRGQRVVFAGPGSEGDEVVLSLSGSDSVVISANAHGAGKNLQQFSRNLLATPPSSGGEWEQLIGRTVRAGQDADEVTVETYRHTEPLRKAIDKARELSEYIEGTFGASQKLASKATWLF